MIDRGAAALAASLESPQHKHPITEIAKFRGDVLELLPVLARVGGEPFDALASAVDAAALEGPRQRRPPLEVGGHDLGEGAIDVAAVAGINHSLGDVHFVSGHRLGVSRSPPALYSVASRS